MTWRPAALAVLILLMVTGCSGDQGDHPAGVRNVPAAGGSSLGSAGARGDVAAERVCGNRQLLGTGPAAPPDGAVAVPAGDNASVDFGQVGKTYWFAPGTHTLGSGEYSSIVAAADARYVGAPGAVLDGRKVNKYAFTGDARDVTVSHLTIESFGAVGSNNNEGVVNHDSADDWTIEHNTVRYNAGAGVMLGSGNVARYNCLTQNEQYGFNAYSERGPENVVLDHNEISYNNTYDWEARVEGCGCTGGGKFWSVRNATVTNNFVHHNHSVGLWVDNNNRGFLVQGNVVSDNADVGILYETSYNAVIRDNTILRNGWVAGPKNPGFPTAAIYVSESGGDRRVPGRFTGTFEIVGNLLKDNWSGVVLWENADRFCGSPANTSTGECTLVEPGQVTAHSCSARNIARSPYYSDCRWKTQNVAVRDNTFDYDPERIGRRCMVSNGCGLNAVMSNYGSYPDWSPYKGTTVQHAITYRQDNVFSDNTYRGPWHFVPFDHSWVKSFRQWRGARYGQDARSTFDPAAGG